MNAIRLRRGRYGKLKSGYPWIHKRQILKTDPSIKPGDVVSVTNSDGVFAGLGYYNSRSDIAIRILTFKMEKIDEGFFGSRIKKAALKRKDLLGITNAYRVVFSEADGLPGLIVDIYRDTLVFQILTFGMEKFKPLIVESLRDVLRPKYIYEKSISPFRKLEGLKDIKGWCGQAGETDIEIFEGPAKFVVDIKNGHKTGFYLDQRKSRMALVNISKDKKVLDLFCYTGAFGIDAAIYGAKSVLGIDIKKEWLDLASKNAMLNGVSSRVSFLRGDVFHILRNIYNSKEKFDIIIVDPPSFVKTKSSLKGALRGYKELNLIAMKSLNDGGVLVTFSCSHHMRGEIFSKVLKEASKDAKKSFRILKRCHQAEDHPVVKAIPETEYLKGYFLEIQSS